MTMKYSGAKDSGLRLWQLDSTPELTCNNIVLYFVNSAVLVVVILTALAACSPGVEPSDAPVYRSVWSELYPDSLNRKPSQDTLRGSFHFAASAGSQSVAKQRWEKFLSTWTPSKGQLEDAMQGNYLAWATLELQRVTYLQHNNQSGVQEMDKKLRELASEF